MLYTAKTQYFPLLLYDHIDSVHRSTMVIGDSTIQQSVYTVLSKDSAIEIMLDMQMINNILDMQQIKEIMVAFQFN